MPSKIPVELVAAAIVYWRRMTDKEYEKCFREMQDAIARDDNENAHYAYDQLIHALAERHEKVTVAHLDELVSGIQFWYA